MTTKDTVFSLEAERTRNTIAAKKDELRKGHDRRLELEIEGLEAQVERLGHRHAEAVKHEEQREAERKQHEQDAREALERRLMDAYRQGAPGTTEEEAKAALPDLLHRHRLAAQDRTQAAIKQAAARYRL